MTEERIKTRSQRYTEIEKEENKKTKIDKTPKQKKKIEKEIFYQHQLNKLH